MLDRTTARAARRRRLRAARTRRYRQRQRDGLMVVPVPLNCVMLDWLIERAHWVSDADSRDRTLIGEKIAAGFAASAKADSA